VSLLRLAHQAQVHSKVGVLCQDVVAVESAVAGYQQAVGQLQEVVMQTGPGKISNRGG
jgi:hypothetical protein